MKRRLTKRANKKNFRRTASKLHRKNLTKNLAKGGYCL